MGEGTLEALKDRLTQVGAIAGTVLLGLVTLAIAATIYHWFF
jgi:hypothetical protein